MKRALKIVFFSVLGLVIVAGVLMWLEFGPLLKEARRCKECPGDFSIYHQLPFERTL